VAADAAAAQNRLGAASISYRRYDQDADGPFVDVKRNPKAAAVPGVVILRVESGLFFANADAVRENIRANAADPNVETVVLDAETIPFH
jgi:MFS superfamily sulfate permease-like transporter